MESSALAKYKASENCPVRNKWIPYLIQKILTTPEEEHGNHNKDSNQVKNILDYGCGTGDSTIKFFTPLIHENPYKPGIIYGIDSSLSMIQHCQTHSCHPNIIYQVGNILEEDGKFPSIKFDLIFSIYTLHLIKNYKLVFQRFHEHLNENGLFAFISYVHGDQFRIYQKMMTSPKWASYFEGLDSLIPSWIESNESAESAYKKAFLDLGYEILEFQTHLATTPFPDLKSIVDFEMTVNPFVKNVPEESSKNLRSEYEQEILQAEPRFKLVFEGDKVLKPHEIVVGLVRKI